MLACDDCDKVWHLRCAGMAAVPAGDWYCAGCLARRLRVDAPTYEISRRAPLGRADKRARIGLGAGGAPTMAELAIVRLHADSEATREKRASVERRLGELLALLSLPRDDPAVFGLYVTWRIKAGRAESTIRSEMALLRRIEGLVLPDDSEYDRLKRATQRLAEVPSGAKEPILPGEMALLRGRLVGRTWQDSGSEESHRALRNWTFFLTAFVGLFRSSELLGMTWGRVRFGWSGSDGVVELGADECPRGRVPEYAALILDETKTQRLGAVVRVKAAPPGSAMLDCPVRLLLRLRALARGDFLFEDTRRAARFAGQPVGYDTMLNAFKETLAQAGIGAGRLSRLALHSLRKGGATAAAAAGASMREIMTQGRWRTDVAYIYALISDQRALELTGRLVNCLREA